VKLHRGRYGFGQITKTTLFFEISPDKSQDVFEEKVGSSGNSEVNIGILLI